MKIRNLCLTICCLSLLCGRAQDQRKLDSLNTLLRSAHDTMKASITAEIANVYLNARSPEAEAYVVKAMELAKKSGLKKGLADASYVMGAFYYNVGVPDSAMLMSEQALAFYKNNKTKLSMIYDLQAMILQGTGKMAEAKKLLQQSLQIQRGLRDSSRVASIYTNLAEIAGNEGKFDEAVSDYLHAQKIFETLGDRWGEAICLNNVANVYGYQGQFKKAIGNYEKVLEISRQLNKTNGILNALDNMGADYIPLHDTAKSHQFLNEAYELCVKQGNEGMKARVMQHLAMLFHEKKDASRSEHFYVEAMHLYEKNNNIEGLSAVYTNLGVLYQEQQRYVEAIHVIDKSIAVFKQIGLKPELKIAYQNLSICYAGTKNFYKAYAYSALYAALNDSLNNEKTTELIADMEAKYENDKKEKELALKNSQLSKKELEIREQNLQKLFFAGGAALLLLVGILLYRGNSQKKKANDQLKAQKDEIVQQKAIIEDKNKDITDSIKYAKRIQEAILPPPATVSKLLNDHFIFYAPKDIVSGDFYWVEKKDDLIFFAVADCTGHGVPGALMSVVCSGALGKAVKENGLSQPAAILDFISQNINSTLRQKDASSTLRDGMDVALCAYDPRTQQLEYAGANNPLYLLRNGELSSVTATKQPVGSAMDDLVKPFANNSLQLQKGDTLYLFSDGYADQFGGPQGKKYKYSRFQKFLIGNNSLPMAQISEKLAKEFAAWKSDYEQVDDVCVMGVRI